VSVRRLEVIFLVLAVLATGCMRAPVPEPTETTPAAPTPSETEPRLDLPPDLLPDDAGTLPYLRFEDCDGALLTGEVPRARVDSYVPAPLTPRSTVPGLAQLNVEMHRCQRTVVGSLVFTDVAFIRPSVSVIPKNDSWQNRSFSSYTVDLLVSPPELAERVNQVSGAPVQAASFQESSQTVPNGYVLATWAFRSDNVSFDVSFHYPTNAPSQPSPTRYHFWSGQGPLVRWDIRQTSFIFTPQGNAGATFAGSEPDVGDPAPTARLHTLTEV
jgi:hypothetical protein